MVNTSDNATVEHLEENFYWQYFCGYEYPQIDPSVSETTIRRFRNLLGEEGLTVILSEMVKVGLKIGKLKKKDLEEVIVDSTVQKKNIKHPHDAILMSNAREKLVKLFVSLGIKLNDTYEKHFKGGLIKIWKYKQDSKAKAKWREMKSLKTRLGRLIRLMDRMLISRGLELGENEAELFGRIKAIHAQSCLKRKAREEYKSRHKIIYSLHEPDVECIGKGKLYKPYEFGNKVGIVVSSKENFILGIKSFHGNPYDGHTLRESLETASEVTKMPFQKAFADMGYSGHDVSSKRKVFLPNTKRKNLSTGEKKMMKRRNSIEPVIGHLKQYGRVGRNFLRGKIGDILNPIISAIGKNLRSLANYIFSAEYAPSG